MPGSPLIEDAIQRGEGRFSSLQLIPGLLPIRFAD